MTAKSVIVRPQGLRPRARAPLALPSLLRHSKEEYSYTKENIRIVHYYLFAKQSEFRI